MNTSYLIGAVAVMALVTILLRFLPFWIFGGGKKSPAWINYLGKVLPAAIMAMLAVYCLKSTDFSSDSHGLPELISSLLVILLHRWKHNTLLSILAGTVCYMLLVQLVF